MKAIYIYPKDIGAAEWSNKWVDFIKKLGYQDGNPIWQCALICLIEIVD